MKEVIVKYDENTGTTYDMDDILITTWIGLEYREVPEGLDFAPNSLDKITKLKSMMSVDEILALKEAGLL